MPTKEWWVIASLILSQRTPSIYMGVLTPILIWNIKKKVACNWFFSTHLSRIILGSSWFVAIHFKGTDFLDCGSVFSALTRLVCQRTTGWPQWIFEDEPFGSSTVGGKCVAKALLRYSIICPIVIQVKVFFGFWWASIDSWALAGRTHAGAQHHTYSIFDTCFDWWCIS